MAAQLGTGAVKSVMDKLLFGDLGAGGVDLLSL